MKPFFETIGRQQIDSILWSMEEYDGMKPATRSALLWRTLAVRKAAMLVFFATGLMVSFCACAYMLDVGDFDDRTLPS